jgi:hypothetical protein
VLIATTTRTALEWAGLATALAGGAVAVAALRRRKRAGEIAGGALFLLGLLGAGFLAYLSRDVITVRDDDHGDPVAVREAELGARSGHVLVINHSAHDLRIEEVTYEQVMSFSTAAPKVTPVPAGATLDFPHAIPNVGPLHPPPDHISSKDSHAVTYYLTW